MVWRSDGRGLQRWKWEVRIRSPSSRQNVATMTSRRTARMLRLQVATCVALSLLGSLLLLPLGRRGKDDLISNSDRRLAIFLERLQLIQAKEEAFEANQTAIIEDLVRRKFPWLIKNNTIPNAFLFPYKPVHASSNSKDHRRPVMVLVHIPRTGGGALRDCWKRLGHNRTILMSPMSEELRTVWDDPRLLTPSFRNAFDAHAGMHTFGMCDRVNRPCSYTAILRHPLSRSISSYQHCRQSLGDPVCAAVNANDVTLRDWILLHGSFFFRSLLFNSRECRHNVFNVTDINLPLLNPKQLPCWLKQKLWLDTVSSNDKHQLLEYILKNLERWFTVLGTNEDMTSLAAMFEHVFKLPFSQCETLSRTTSPNLQGEALRLNTAHAVLPSVISYEEYLELQYDYDVENALKEDLKLYKRVRDIVQMQKQVFLNKLKS